MTNIRELLCELARPRMTGSTGAHEVASIVRARLDALNYQVLDLPFTFSTLPGRFSITIGGFVFLACTLGAAALLNQGHPGVALVILALALIVCGGIAILAPLLSEILPLARTQGANLLAFRAGVRPRYIVMAHLDSKSQPLPLAFRGPAIAFAIICWIALTVLATLALLDPVYLMPRVTIALAIVCFLAGVLLIFCWVDNQSPGALDNASGVATLLGIAARADHDDVAYLFTDAEEFGLVGARSIAGKLDPVIGVINVDGIDDHGTFYILERFGLPRRHIAPHLAAALLTAADELAVPAHRRDVPFGLLLDHIPLAQAKLPAVTLARGTVMRSLRRVHRPADSVDVMTGVGIERAIELINRALAVLHREPAGARL